MADLVSFGLVELLGLLVEFVQVELSDDVLLVEGGRDRYRREFRLVHLNCQIQRNDSVLFWNPQRPTTARRLHHVEFIRAGNKPQHVGVFNEWHNSVQ